MKNISHAATVITVRDPERTAVYYQEKLRFDITFQWEDPPSYVVLKKEDVVSIHLTKGDPSNYASSIYIFCHDVDAIYEEMVESGATITNSIGDREYHMRDFDVEDNNGFRLTFGTSLE